MELKGKNVIITGGGVRIGKAISLALAQEGCHLLIHYHSSHKQALEVKIAAEKFGVKAFIHQCDLSKKQGVLSLMYAARDLFGNADVLINNAALYLNLENESSAFEDFESQMNVNVRAPYFLSKHFAEQLPEKGKGKIINISDAAVSQVRTDYSAYRLTKTALNSMTKNMALEFAPNICVNAVALGIMLPLEGKEDDYMENYAKFKVPLKTTGNSKVVTDSVIYLLEQDYLTGVVLKLDGGEFLG
ncbi:MAG: SDR family oxidoreductase [Anaerolineaceae bacterium]|nr:SDR family oxidoreductase [Anaerolineaceae bacterium]